MTENYLLTALVENKPGVLHKVSNMFRSRGFNINSISVGLTQHPDISRMTITINTDPARIQQFVKQLRKLIDVIDVSLLEFPKSVYRELALIKVHTPAGKARAEIIGYANIFRARVVDVSTEYLTMEITGTPDKIDAFMNLAKTYGLKEVSRTGVTALPREGNHVDSSDITDE